MADELLAAATLLSSEERFGAIALMLRGMAVECLLKAAWVKRGHVLVEDGRYVGVRGAGEHQLVQLAFAAELPLDAHETDVLRRLTHFVEYGGRYPIPKHAAALQLTRSPHGGFAPSTTWTTPPDSNVLQGLLRRIEALLE